jgi:hypothetical protein
MDEIMMIRQNVAQQLLYPDSQPTTNQIATPLGQTHINF